MARGDEAENYFSQRTSSTMLRVSAQDMSKDVLSSIAAATRPDAQGSPTRSAKLPRVLCRCIAESICSSRPCAVYGSENAQHEAGKFGDAARVPNLTRSSTEDRQLARRPACELRPAGMATRIQTFLRPRGTRTCAAASATLAGCPA